MSLKIKYWGVRGSLPAAPLPAQWSASFEQLLEGFFRSGFATAAHIKDYMATHSVTDVGGFGTATTCVEINSLRQQIIIDGGSGIRTLSEQMMQGPAGQGKAEIHLFLTHFHWDHMLGLPFFAPHFVKGNKIHYYAVQAELPDMVKTKFKRPLFPVAFESLAADIQFHQLKPRELLQLGDIKVTPYQLDHPDPCWGYRVESGGRSYAHCVDTEGTRISREDLGADLPLYQNVDLMYFDAQYTLPELAEKANWGHSAAQLGLEIGFREGIKRILFAHHDPGADTAEINELKKQTQDYFVRKLKTHPESKLQWSYAYEGLEVDLDSI